MRINEKNLCAFAVANTPIDKAGWLQKRGEVNRALQRRWFVLKGNLLFYFEKNTDKEPLGLIVLDGCTIEVAEDEERYMFKIVFHGPGNRSYILGADSEESMEEWMKALAFADYDCLKSLVENLEQQLNEIEEIPTVLDSSSMQRVGVPKEGTSSAPQAPPRQRQNPFNKNNGEPYVHHRSYSLRMASDGSISGHSPRTEIHYKNRASFRDVHNLYGRRILSDWNEWKHKRKQQEQPLIVI